jgi:hypothetical protein
VVSFGSDDNDDAANETPEDESSDDAANDGAGTEDNDDSSDEDDSQEFDAQAELEALRDGTMSKAEFVAFERDLKRRLGQVSALQSKMDKLQEATPDADMVQSDSEILGALIAALPTVLDTSDPAFASLRALQEKRAQLQVTRDAIAKMREDAPANDSASDDGTGNGMSSEDAAAWNTASSLVNGYARAKGIDPSTVEKPVWDKAVADSMGIPDRAAELMYGVIDKMAKGSDSRQADRADRKAAGKTRSPGKSGGGASSTLTLAKLQGMSPEQIMKLPPEEVDKVLAG